VQLSYVPEFTAYGARKFCFVVNTASIRICLHVTENEVLNMRHLDSEFGNRSDYAYVASPPPRCSDLAKGFLGGEQSV
jgi:hypothetical protein